MKHACLIADGGIGSAIHDALTKIGYEVVILSRKQDINLFKHQNLKDILSSHTELPSLVINICGILYDESHMLEKKFNNLNMIG